MDAFLHQVLAGLATGGIYASLALALVMIYQATHLVNFAQGEMAMFSTYIAWSLINAGMPYWPAFLLTVGIAFILGILIERIVVRPVENAPVLVVVVVFIGLLVILNSVAGWIYTYTIKSFPSPFPRQPILGIHYISAHELGGIASAGGAVLGGFAVGVLENVLGAFVIGNELKLAVALVLIVGVLLVKPSGLFGRVYVTRV